MPQRASLVVFFGLAGAIMLMVGISAGAAQEDSRFKQVEVGDAQERLMQTRMEQSAAFESYNAALRELNQLDSEIAGAEQKLQAAEEQSARAQRDLEDRASQVYKSGNVAFMDVLVGVDDFSDFATRVDLWMKLLEDERAEFEDLRQARDELKAQKDLLETQRAQRTEAIEAAINRKEQAENAEADAQAYLDSLSGELRSLIQAEQERRAAEARANAEKLRAKFAAQTAQTPTPEPAPDTVPEPAPERVAQAEELPKQQLSLQAQQPAPEPQPEPQTQEVVSTPQPKLQAQEAASAPPPDPELLAKQQEAERLAAERRAAAEQARAAQAEAERQAELAAQKAEAQQKAADRREARERAAAAEAARRQAEQAAIEQAAADLEAQQAAERQAQVRAQRQADLETQRQAEQAAAEEQYEVAPAAEVAPVTETDPAGTDLDGPVSTEEPAPTGAAPPASTSGNAVVSEGAKYLGTPYVLGGWESCLPYEMMDCACFTATVYQAFGFSLPDSPGGQMAYGTPVSGPPAAGDLVFWSEDGSGYITHVGIAMGDGTTIHASAYTGMVVSGTPIDAIPGYAGAVRLL